MSWTAPAQSPVAISHLLVQWRIDNDVQLHEANVTDANTANNTFRFPNTTSTDQLFITVRSVGHNGHTSIPVYYNMHDELHQQQHDGRDDASAEPPTTLPSDAAAAAFSRRRLEAIAIGVSMSALLVTASVLFIVWHRRYAKRQRNATVETNGCGRERGLSNSVAATSNGRWSERGHFNNSDSILSRSPVAQDGKIRRPSPAAMTTLTAVDAHNDAHEMQSLMQSPNNGSAIGNAKPSAKLAKSGNGRSIYRPDGEPTNGSVLKPLFTSTPEKRSGIGPVAGGVESQPAHYPHAKPLSPNNNKEITIGDSSRQPLFNETDTDASSMALPTDDDDEPTAIMATTLDQRHGYMQTMRLPHFVRGYQRPLVGPNG